MSKSYDVSFLHEQLNKNPVAVHEFYQWVYTRYVTGLHKDDARAVEHFFKDLPYAFQYGLLISFFHEQGKIMLLSADQAKGFFERMFAAIENKEEYPDPDRDLMSVGANAIFQERIKQIQKHGYTTDSDKVYNNKELLQMAAMLITGDMTKYPSWMPIELCEKLMKHSERERYVIAGALIAAHLDLEAEEEKLNNE
jgi:hypothetical protein